MPNDELVNLIDNPNEAANVETGSTNDGSESKM
jgi:hypothetical protein